MAKTKEFFKEMNKSEKAIEKRLKKDLYKNKEVEDLEDIIIHLKEEIDVLKGQLKDAKAELAAKNTAKKRNTFDWAINSSYYTTMPGTLPVDTNPVNEVALPDDAIVATHGDPERRG